MIFCNEKGYKNRKEVVTAYPTAEKIVKVCGGWAVFYSIYEYQTWKKQK